MYLQKLITSGHAVAADCWILDNVYTYGLGDDIWGISGSVKLYKSYTDFVANPNAYFDACEFIFKDLTTAEVDGGTRVAVLNRLKAPNLDGVTSENLNVYQTKKSGIVDFSDAVLVQN